MTNWIISSSILIITIILLRSMFRNKISLRLQYALWFLVAVRLLIPLNFGTSVLSIENLTNQLTLQTQIERTTENNRQNISSSNEYRDHENSVKIYEGVENTLSDSADIISEENIPKTETSRSQEIRSISEIVPQILFCTWVAGIFVLGMVFIITNMRFRKRLMHTRRKLDVTYSNLPVYISKEVDSPCLFGIFRPCIYVTKAVAEDSMILRHSIYHETTHYKHGDMLWALIRCVCLAIHWYNPLVWWAAKLSKQDSELACDEATIARLGETERLAYGKTLIQLTCGKRNDLFSAATTMTSEKKSITERIKLIAKKPKIRAYALISIVLIMLISVVCAFTNAANKKTETEISETQKNSQNNSDIETMDSDTANDNDESSSFSFLSDPLPGIPCENPADSGWDLKNAKDVRTKWSNMSYVPEEGTENDTYLIGKTKQFTLYGKGDFETMLLECNGKYAEIRHDYTSNYMTPLELMEMDFDKDGQNELSIKFNVKHGTGLYIDTFLLADFGLDNQLYVHQFLEEDFTAQLAEHLSFEKTEKGIQPLVEGKPAGVFVENEENMDPFSATSVGAQMRFYYNEIKNEVQLSGEIMLLIEGYPGNLWTSGNDITATVHWDGTHFYLSDFTSKNRSLDEQVYYALVNLYDVPDLYYVDVRYDSAKMNQETMVISAEILPDENDSSYDYAEVHLKRAYTNYISGWEIENIYLEK